MSEIREKLRNLIVDYLDVEQEKVTDDAKFIVDLGADSLDIVEIVIAIEEDFNVEISDSEQEKLYDGTFNDLAVLIEGKKNG